MYVAKLLTVCLRHISSNGVVAHLLGVPCPSLTHLPKMCRNGSVSKKKDSGRQKRNRNGKTVNSHKDACLMSSASSRTMSSSASHIDCARHEQFHPLYEHPVSQQHDNATAEKMTILKKEIVEQTI